MTRLAPMLLGFALIACGPTMQQQRELAAQSVRELQAGRFVEGEVEAKKAIERDPSNPEAHVVRAFATLKAAGDALFEDLRVAALSVVVSGGGFHYARVRQTIESAAASLSSVDADLAVAERADWLGIELCLACWEIDWNHNGEVDDRDRRLLELEEDAEGHEIAPEDPRRRPTFRFDHGDVLWGRALVSFGRAALEIVLAYDWQQIGLTVFRFRAGDRHVVFKLLEPKRILRAKALIEDGLAFSDRARLAYLAEADDDREWLPSPRQKSHPLPLPVDDALYETWRSVVADAKKLVAGKEGLSVADLAALAERKVEKPISGYIDVGSMLATPKDLSFDINELKGLRDDPEGTLRALYGSAYVKAMPASSLPKTLLRMRGEVKAGTDSWRRKMRYLFWIN